MTASCYCFGFDQMLKDMQKNNCLNSEKYAGKAIFHRKHTGFWKQLNHICLLDSYTLSFNTPGHDILVNGPTLFSTLGTHPFPGLSATSDTHSRMLSLIHIPYNFSMALPRVHSI